MGLGDRGDVGEQCGQRREVEVAFRQGGAHADTRIGLAEQCPDRALYRRAVGVDLEAIVLVEMAGDVQRCNAMGRDAGEEIEGVVVVVAGVDEDIVDVQQQVAVRFGQHGVDEVDLAHVRAGHGVVGDVLHRDAPAQHVLHLGDAPGDVLHGFTGERQRQQVVDVATGSAVAQVLAVQLHLVQVEEGAGLCQQGAVQRVRAAQRQRQAVAGQAVALAELAQRGTVGTADADPVVGRDLEEIDGIGGHCQQFVNQSAAQAKTSAGGRQGQGHARYSRAVAPPRGRRR